MRSWDHLDVPNSRYNVFRVPQDDLVFKEVYDKLLPTLVNGNSSTYDRCRDLNRHYLRDVLCLANKEDFDFYQFKRSKMAESADVPSLNETWLFHGTKADTFLRILSTGITRDYSGVTDTNGSAWGKGLYTTLDASYAFGYTDITKEARPPVLQINDRVILLGRGLCGNTTNASQNAQGILTKQIQGKNRNYDCYIGATHMRIFASGSDHSFYPDFALIVGWRKVVEQVE